MDTGGLIVGALLVVSGAALLWVSWLGSQRRLRPNAFVGIRLPVTRRDEPSWYAAHEAAAGPLGVAGGVTAAGGLALLATGLEDTVGVVVALVTAAGALAGVLVAARAAVRAAHATRAPA